MARRDSPHDTLFKEIFSRPAQAAALLRHALPRAESRRIRWDQLELQDSGLRVHHGELRADLLFRAPAPPHCAPFLLLEHKSSPDAATCYQVFGYVGGIWRRYRIRRRRRITGLPAVFVVIVVHGRRKWRRGRKLVDLIDWPPAPGCMPSVPIFVVDLSGMSTDELRKLPLPALAKVALFCLARVRDSRDFLAELRGWIPELRTLQADDDGVDGLESVLWYVMQVGNVPWTDLEKFLELEVGPMAKQALMTTAQQLIKEAREKAKAEGVAQGLAEGLAKGLAQALLKQLTVRFGELPAGVEERVRRATALQRERWLERVLGARTLDEVLQDD